MELVFIFPLATLFNIMKSSITIFIFLLQALFISASAMNETPIPADSSSEIKVIFLRDFSELNGKIISQTKDTLNFLTEDGIIIQIPNSEIKNIYSLDYYAKNNIYFDAGFIQYINYYNINYERLLSKKISIRIGYGYAKSLGSLGDGAGKDGEILSLLCNFLLNKGESKFEIGIGATYCWKKTQERINEDYQDIIERTYSFTPAVGYRYQPQYGGLFFKAGISIFYPGAGLNLSLGYTF